MEDNVVSFRNGEAIKNGQSYPDVIELLANMLEAAKRGEIASVVIIGTSPTGHAINCWSIEENGIATLGAMELTRTEILLRQVESRDYIGPEDNDS